MGYVIYKICCDDCDEIYVGSTKNFTNRKSKHKGHTNNNDCKSHYKIYKTIRENGGWDNWRMMIIEECDESITTRVQAQIREEEHRIKLKATLNQIKAFSSEEDKRVQHLNQSKKYYHQKTEEERKELGRKRYNKAKDMLNEKTECECGCVINFQSLNRHKKTEKHKKLMHAKD